MYPYKSLLKDFPLNIHTHKKKMLVMYIDDNRRICISETGGINFKRTRRNIMSPGDQEIS